MFSKELEVSLNSIFKQAREKRYEYLTVEHLLLALLDEPSAVAALKACGANLNRLKNEISNFIAATTPLFPSADPNLDTTHIRFSTGVTTCYFSSTIQRKNASTWR